MHRLLAASVIGLISFFFASQLAFSAGQMSIDQVDTSRLATHHVVDVYVQVSNPNAQPAIDLAKGDFSLFDGSRAVTGTSLPRVRRFSLHQGPRSGEGVTYLILVDSTAATAPAGGSSASAEINPGWFETVRASLEYFLNSVENPEDRIGVAAFDSAYRIESEPTRTRSATEAALQKMALPASGGKSLGTVAALSKAANELVSWRGRKVIILLTGERSLSSSLVAERLLQDQISLVAMQFGIAGPDPTLRSIAKQSGGRAFAVETKRQLESALTATYAAVRGEYRLSFSPRMTPGSYRKLRVEYRGRNGTISAEQQYRVGNLFAVPGGKWNPVILLPLVLTLLLLVISRRVRIRSTRRGPTLEVLGAVRSSMFSLETGTTSMLFDSNHATVVPSGSGGSVDRTVRLDRGEAAQVTGSVAFTVDESSRSCTVESETTVLVNNRRVRRRALRAGDVLRIGETTVIFDDPR